MCLGEMWTVVMVIFFERKITTWRFSEIYFFPLASGLAAVSNNI
jgi:hypothetical protein